MVGKTAVLPVPIPGTEESEPQVQRAPKRRPRRYAGPLAAYGLLVAVAVVLVLLYVAQYAYVAQLNLRLAAAQKELARATAALEQLEQQASELKSLARIEREARERLGMREPEEVKVVAAPLPPAAEEAPVSSPAPRVPAKKDKITAILSWARGLRQALARGVAEEN